MGMENRPGVKIELICNRCGTKFIRPKVTIRKGQKEVFCSKECFKKPKEEKLANRRISGKKWRENNPDKVRKQRMEWRVVNIESVKVNKREWYKKNKDKINEKARNGYKNKESSYKASQKYQLNNKEKILKRNKEWQKNNPEKVRQTIVNYKKNNRAKHYWSRIRMASIARNVNFDLTKEWFQERLDIGVCEMSGICFDMEGKKTPNSPSIDRIIAGGNYTKDNCRMILWCINVALSNFGEKYMIDVFKKIIAKKENNDG